MTHDRLRKPKMDFTQVPNDLICSPEISCKGKAVYCYLISRPDDWKFYTKEIVKNMKESINTVETALKELIDYGWIEKQRYRDEKGHLRHSIYTLFYEALSKPQKTKLGKTKLGKTKIGKLIPTNTKQTNTKQTNTNLTKEKKKKEIIVSSPSSLKVANFLLSKILGVNPNFKVNNFDRWMIDIDLSINEDKRTENELIECIEWIYTPKGSFWQKVILNGKKLRDKFDTMNMQYITTSLSNENLKQKDEIDTWVSVYRKRGLSELEIEKIIKETYYV